MGFDRGDPAFSAWSIIEYGRRSIDLMSVTSAERHK
jgi:hypothetical protein